MSINHILKYKGFFALLLIAVLCSVTVSYFRERLTSLKVSKVEHQNIDFNSLSPDTTLARVKEYKSAIRSEPKDITINFSVKALDDNYDNIFQTADDPATLRLELIQPKTLNLIIGTDQSGLKIHTITNNFILNTWHLINLSIDENKIVQVTLDGNVALRLTDSSIRYDISDIAIGAGFQKQRGFQGEIKDFHLKYEGYQRVFFLEIFIALLFLLPFMIIMVYEYKIFSSHYIITLSSATPHEISFVPGVSLISILLGYFAGLTFGLPPIWLSFLSLGFVTPVIYYSYVKLFGSNSPNNLTKSIRTLPLLGILIAIVLLVFNSFEIYSLAPLLSILCVAIAVVSTMTYAGYLPVSLTKHNGRLASTVVLILFSTISWIALFDLPNWFQFSKSLKEQPVITPVLFFLFLGVIRHYLFKTTRPYFPQLSRSISIPIISSVLVVFFLMSFRFDTFFAGTSEGHWEYFIGPLRNMKNGSWLLWDTPSQYGFLNLLIANSIPLKSPWESFYIFQGTLLFLTSIMMFKVFMSDRSIGSGVIFSFSITFSSLFFADPDLIGPYLYPSSSVVRFFWCYVLLFFLLYGYARFGLSVMKTISIGSALWLTGFLWSSESAIYSSVIFFPAILTMILQDYHKRVKIDRDGVGLLKHIVYHFSIPILGLMVLICLITLYYQIWLSHFPDFFAFLEHGFAYAGGFGVVLLNPFGPVWILFLLFSTILFVTIRLALKNPYDKALVPLVGVVGCLWGISSYFIGRPVPNNVTAILPILSFATLVVLESGARSNPDFSYSILKIVTVPLFVIILMTSFGNIDFVKKLKDFQTLTFAVSTKVRSAEPSLQDLIEEANIRDYDTLVYYGYAAALPRWKVEDQFVISDKSWLPNPLQLIEEPIPEARAKIYIHRFVQRSKGGGYFIQAKGEAEDRAANWLKIIQETHRPVRNFENNKWRIIYFEPRQSKMSQENK